MVRWFMRFAAVAVLMTLASVSVLAQNSEHQASPVPERTFTNPDGTFQFEYPSQPAPALCLWGAIEECQGAYIPTCEPYALVCVEYMSKYTTGGFQVKLVPGDYAVRNGADVCVTPEPNKGDPRRAEFLISAESPVEQIGGITFVHGVFGGAAAGHSSWEDIYRAFHDGKCYELRITTTQADVPPIPAPDKETVRQGLFRILHSFRFLTH